MQYYASFHEDGSARVILKQAEEFLPGGKYILDIADVCVAATANYLHMNLYIFENLEAKQSLSNNDQLQKKQQKVCFFASVTSPVELLQV